MQVIYFKNCFILTSLLFIFSTSAWSATLPMFLIPQKGVINLAGINNCQLDEVADSPGLYRLQRKNPAEQTGPVSLQMTIKFQQNLKSDDLPLGTALTLSVAYPAVDAKTAVPTQVSPAATSKSRPRTLLARWRDINNISTDLGELIIPPGDDFHTLTLPVPPQSGRIYNALNLYFLPDPDVVLVRDLKLSRPSGLTLQLVSNPVQIQETLTVNGQVDAELRVDNPDFAIDLCLRDATGKIQRQPVNLNPDGYFQHTWTQPPISLDADNQLYLEQHQTDNVTDAKLTSLLLTLYGYPADNSHLWLQVKGKYIMTSAQSAGGENIFVPVGIGYCKDVIIPGQDSAVMQFCRDRSLNTVRLSFYTRFFNNKNDAPLDIDQHIADFVDPVVRAARRYGLYVILDDHGYFTEKIDENLARETQTVPRWSEQGITEWIARWRKVAERYKDEPTVLGYELMNEPHDISPKQTREWYTRCLKSIREIDSRHIVLVGNADWSHARAIESTWGEVASNVDAPYNNIVFAFHDYPDDNHPWIVQKYITRFRDKYNVPVMCTEFGATHWNKSETVCRSFISGMVTLFAQEQVGWMIWALKRLEDQPFQTINQVDQIGLEPKRFDSCSYSDIWIPAARIMASPMPQSLQSQQELR